MREDTLDKQTVWELYERTAAILCVTGRIPLYCAAHGALMARPGYISSREVSRSAHKVQCHEEGAFLLNLVTPLCSRCGTALQWNGGRSLRTRCDDLAAQGAPGVALR